ncbi:MAG: alkaline phosphatase family protein [Polyangiales bacterium]
MQSAVPGESERHPSWLLFLSMIIGSLAVGCGSNAPAESSPPTDAGFGGSETTASEGATDGEGDDSLVADPGDSGAKTVADSTLSDSPVVTDVMKVDGASSTTRTVVLILMENHNWSQIKGSSAAPYINKKLLPKGAHAENFQNIIHPSEPNYIWLEAGDNLGVSTDKDPTFNSQATTSHLTSYLEKAGISWKGWQGDISGADCPLSVVGLYAPKHNPMVFFQDVTDNNSPTSKHCIDHVRPYGEFAAALTAGTIPRYNFVTPNLCNDMHNCGIAAGDAWLAKEVPAILASKAYLDGGVLLITWDETELLGTTFGMIVMSPSAKVNYANSIKYTHSSTLRTIEELLGVTPLLRDAAKATSLSDMFTTYP